MGKWSPQLTSSWKPADLESIIQEAARVLEEIGVSCTHRKVGAIVAEKITGATYRNERLYFARKQVMDHVQKQREAGLKTPEKEEPPFSLGACWMGLNYCDPETQKIRPATTQEATQMARFWDVRDVNWCIPLNPGDVSPALTTLAGERIALKNSHKLGGFLTVLDPEEVRFLIDMFQAAGRPHYRLNEQVGISPLRFNEEGLETAMQFMGKPHVKVILSGSIPMAGATCPLDPRSAVIQSLAETLGQDFLCSALQVDGGGLLRVEAFDLQYSTIVWGSAEWCLYHALLANLREYLSGGHPGRGGFFRTIAKQPDNQAMCERTASALWQALLGARKFSAVGQLCIDEVFSPQQVIFDKEILGYVERVIKGLDLGPSMDPVATINEGIQQGTFLGTTDTVANFRDFYYFPEVFRHWNLGRWRDEGEPSLLAEAWARAKEEIAKAKFSLTPEQEKEVDRIYDKAQKYVLNKKG